MLAGCKIPIVSIVTPSYNHAQYLEGTILSVLNQDYPNIEYIVVDGGSSDESVDIIKKYGGRITHWESEKDRGQTHALMKGFAKATGKYLAWLCSDDLLEPSMVSISVDYHERHPDVGCTYGDRVRIDKKGNIYSLQRYAEFRPWFLRWCFSLPQETTLFRRAVFESVGKLDESLHMAMDYDLWCRINRVSKIRHIPAVLGAFRAHKSNKSSLFSNQAKSEGAYFDEFLRVYERYYGQCIGGAGIRLSKLLFTVLPLLDRRTKSYAVNLEAAKSIRLS